MREGGREKAQNVLKRSSSYSPRANAVGQDAGVHSQRGNKGLKKPQKKTGKTA